MKPEDCTEEKITELLREMAKTQQHIYNQLAKQNQTIQDLGLVIGGFITEMKKK